MPTTTAPEKESAAHRRQRRKRTVARLIANLAEAKAILSSHHSANSANMAGAWYRSHSAAGGARPQGGNGQTQGEATAPWHSRPGYVAAPLASGAASGDNGSHRRPPRPRGKKGGKPFKWCDTEGCNGWEWKSEIRQRSCWCSRCGSLFPQPAAPPAAYAEQQLDECDEATALVGRLQELHRAGGLLIPGWPDELGKPVKVVALDQQSAPEHPNDARRTAERHMRDAFQRQKKAHDTEIRLVREMGDLQAKLAAKAAAQEEARKEVEAAAASCRETSRCYDAACQAALQAAAAKNESSTPEAGAPATNSAEPAVNSREGSMEVDETYNAADEERDWAELREHAEKMFEKTLAADASEQARVAQPDAGEFIEQLQAKWKGMLQRHRTARCEHQGAQDGLPPAKAQRTESAPAGAAAAGASVAPNPSPAHPASGEEQLNRMQEQHQREREDAQKAAEAAAEAAVQQGNAFAALRSEDEDAKGGRRSRSRSRNSDEDNDSDTPKVLSVKQANDAGKKKGPHQPKKERANTGRAARRG